MIRVLIAEDNLLTRLGIEALIATQDDLEVVGFTQRGDEVLRLYKAHTPDILLLDLSMPGMHGLQALTAVLGADPAAKVLVVTDFDTHEDVYHALHGGALGYVTKRLHGPQLLEAIRAVAAGQRHLPAEIADLFVQRSQQEPLSARELQILQGIYSGASNKDLAATMGLSAKTIEMYVTRLLAKLEVKNRTEAIAKGLSRGWIRGG